MEEESSKIIAVFFKYMGLGFFALCIKVSVVNKVSYELVRSLWYTFMYCFTLAIWMGLVVLFTQLIFKYIKKNFVKF